MSESNRAQMFRCLITCLVFFSLSLTLVGQNIDFEAAIPQPNVQGALFGDLEFADVDNDGDADMLICGRVDGWTSADSTRLYLNDGTGTFSEVAGTPFPDVQEATVGFRDLDNDGDQDLLITGQGGFPMYHADLFLNDGTGNFSLLNGTPFLPNRSGGLAFADVDDDGDDDVFMTGNDVNGTSFSRLYLNNGSAVFVQSSQTFALDHAGPVEFLDVDGDIDPDLYRVVSNAGVISTELYLNNGLGSFTLGTSDLPGLSSSAICSGDIDMDGDVDVLITGENTSNNAVTDLYLNDGTGSFSAFLGGSIFPDLSIGENKFADVDNDGDLDMIMTGTGDGGLGSPVGIITNVFENLGSNNYVLADSLTGAYVAENDLADVNGDGLLDIAVGGVTVGNPNFATWLFLNTTPIGIPCPEDVNGDGIVKYVGQDNDRDLILVKIGGNIPTATVACSGCPEDINGDGLVKYVGQNNDRDLILQRIGGNVPTSTFICP